MEWAEGFAVAGGRFEVELINVRRDAPLGRLFPKSKI